MQKFKFKLKVHSQINKMLPQLSSPSKVLATSQNDVNATSLCLLGEREHNVNFYMIQKPYLTVRSRNHIRKYIPNTLM